MTRTIRWFYIHFLPYGRFGHNFVRDWLFVRVGRIYK